MSIKLLGKIKDYRGYVVNDKYVMNQSYLNTVIGILEHSRKVMTNPTIVHIVVYWSDGFKSNSLREVLQQAFKVECPTRKKSISHYDYFYCWVNEYAHSSRHDALQVKGNHTHLFVVFDVNSNSSRERKPKKICTLLSSLDGVNEAYPQPRKYGEGVDVSSLPYKQRYLHDLKTEMMDAVNRYCYFAKHETKLNGRSNIGYSQIPKPKRPKGRLATNPYQVAYGDAYYHPSFS